MARVFKDGQKWKVEWDDPPGLDGKRRRREKTGPNKRYGELFLAKKTREIFERQHLGVRPEERRRRAPFADAAAEYLRYSKTHNRPKSWQRAEGVIRTHLIPHFGGKISPRSQEPTQNSTNSSALKQLPSER